MINELKQTISSAISQQELRSNRNDKVKEKIMSMLNEKIKLYSKSNYTNCIFTIPNFMLGYLSYNTNDIITYIIKILKKQGIFVVKLNDENIYLSWDVNDLYKSDTKSDTKSNTKSNIKK